MVDNLSDWKPFEESIGVDLDGTLADFTDGWQGIDHIGEPLWPMVERVIQWLDEGKKVKIFTARADTPETIPYIRTWLRDKAGLPYDMPITNVKDSTMSQIWDDRAVQMHPNTGEPVLGDSVRALLEQPLPSHLSSDEDEHEESFGLLKQIEKEQS